MRARIMGWILTLALVALIVRSGAIMLFPDPLLETQARNQFKRAQVIEGRRGDILSRDGEFLATSVELQSLHIDHSRLTEETIALIAPQIAPLVNRSAESIIAGFRAEPNRMDLRLARDLLPEHVSPIKSWLWDLSEERHSVSKRSKNKQKTQEDLELRVALFTRTTHRRFYPGQGDAAAVLGLVGRTGLPLAGIERFANRSLTGETFKFIQWRDRRGRRITPDIQEARPGSDLLLTIDRRIQRATEEALDAAMIAVAPVSAQAVVLDVKTGEILAVANRPTHNPNDLSKLNQEAMANKAFVHRFEPGSVFKPFVAAAALEEREVTPQTEYFLENNYFSVRGGRIKDDHVKGTSLNVTEIIKYSSNVGVAKIAFQLGADRTMGYLKGFGFGRDPGLDWPGIASGALRDPAKTKPIELATTAYGHGVSASTLQLASAVATLGNKGVRMVPWLIREIRDADGTPIEVFHPKEDRRVVSEETAAKVLAMMEEVTSFECLPGRKVFGNCRGTGTRARVPGFRVAGKTGTANKYMSDGYSDTERISSFMGLAPADDPKLAIVVMIDGPTLGPSKGAGVVAAPVFKAIAKPALRQLGFTPDPLLLDDKPAVAKTPARPTKPAPPEVEAELRWDAQDRLLTPDLDGLSMRDALVMLQGSGLHIQFEGSGRVVQQSPDPGLPIGPGQPVEVILQ
jgi:cell division protein FtsI (penicillin-binding protein 3)